MKTVKLLIIITFAITTSFYISCNNKKEIIITPAYTYNNTPDGGTAIINGGDLSNQGLLVNRNNTTWILTGNIILSDLSVIGKVIIDPGANVLVKGTVTVSGGAKFIVNGSLTTNNITQTGNSLFSGGNIEIKNQYTIGGGTTTYLQNSKVTVNDLRILGSIVGLENEATKNENIYSVFHFSGNSIYLNRAGGTSVCGPLLFTYPTDQGASGIKLNDITQTVLTNKSTLKDIYKLPSDSKFYQYTDQNCSALSAAPGF